MNTAKLATHSFKLLSISVAWLLSSSIFFNFIQENNFIQVKLIALTLNQNPVTTKQS